MSPAPAVAFHLETPPSAITAGREERIGGWIFGRNGTRCCAVRASDGRREMLALHGLPRADVAAAHPVEPEAGLSGFEIDVVGADHTRLVLEWLDGEGRWHAFWKEAAAPQRTSPPRRVVAELTESLLSWMAGELSAPGEGRSWEKIWRRAGGLLAACPPRSTPLHDAGWPAFLDEPAGDSVSGQYLPVSGWIFGRGRTVARVFATAEPGGLVHLIHPRPRPDVASVHAAAGAPAACGFTGMVKLPPAGTPWFELRLYAEAADGTAHLALVRRFLRKSRADPAARDWRAVCAVGGLALLGRCRLPSWQGWWRELRCSLRRARPEPGDPGDFAESVPPGAGAPRVAVEPLPADPLISILVPVFNPSARHLREMIASVRAQHYPRWELCLADDASTAPHVRPLLQEFAGMDARIRPVFRAENGQIARATNTALAAATGSFVALLDHDDRLAPEALWRVVGALRANPDGRFFYTDRDKIDDRGRHFDVERRGAWNPAMALTHNYLHHLTVIRRDLVDAVGGLRADYFGSQDLDLYLRCHELVRPEQIVHVPFVAYHWRAHAGSTASRGDQKSYMFESARRGIEDALRRRGLRAEAFLPDFASFYGLNLHQLKWDAALVREHPVSIVLAVVSPEEDWPAAVAALARTVPVDPVQLIIVSAGRISPWPGVPVGLQAEHVALPAGTPLASLFNEGARRARNPLLLLQEARAVATHAGWLEDLAGWLSVPGVDAVGPKLIAADGSLASAGWSIGPSTGLPQAQWAGEAPGDLGHQFLLQTARDSLLLDPACLLTRTALFRETGGYAAADFPAGFFAADYCLRLHDRGCRVVFTPQARLRLTVAGRDAGAAPTEAAAFRRRYPGRLDPWIPSAPAITGAGSGQAAGSLSPAWMPGGTVEFAGGWFFLEHPQPGVTLPDGLVVIRGWCVPRAGQAVGELRVRIGRQIRMPAYGHPRADLAAAAGRAGEFMPVGFDLPLVLPAGPACLEFEARWEGCGWQPLEKVKVTVAAPLSGRRAAPVPWDVHLAAGAERLAEGPVAESRATRARALARTTPWLEVVRNPALPFHGFWDEPAGLIRPVYGGFEIRGWLFHETHTIRRVMAGLTAGTRLQVAHGGDSEVIRRRFAQFPGAARCAMFGFVPVPPGQAQVLPFRIWAELDDGSWHLVYVRRCWVSAHDGARRPSRDELVRALLALRWELFRGGLPGPGLPAVWRALRRLWEKSPANAPARVRDVAQGFPRGPASRHVMLVTHNLNREGAPYFLLELALFLQRETTARLTVVSAADGPLREVFEGHGVGVRVLGREPLWAARTPREARRAFAALAGELAAREAGLVIANTIESFWAVLAAHQAGRPSLFYIHEPGVLGLHYLGGMTPAGRALAAGALTQATRVSFPSRAVQAYYGEFGRGHNHCVQPGWTDLGRLLPMDGGRHRAMVRARLGLAAGERLVINVGTLCPRKGQFYFTHAAERLRQTQPALAARCRFLMIGAHDNVYGEMIAAHLAGLAPGHRIELRAATPEIGAYFAAADLFVLTSFEEGFPRVLLEAMGFALPIVSTAIHAIPEIARDGQEALLVPPGDTVALAAAMGRLLEDRELAAQLGERAQFRVESNYTAERVLPLHLRTIRELAPGLAGPATRTPWSDLPESIPSAS